MSRLSFFVYALLAAASVLGAPQFRGDASPGNGGRPGQRPGQPGRPGQGFPSPPGRPGQPGRPGAPGRPPVASPTTLFPSESLSSTVPSATASLSVSAPPAGPSTVVPPAESTSIAAPVPAPSATPSGGCDAAQAVLTVPAGLSTPSTPPLQVLLGVGVQNYTCTDAGTYASAGAVAELFDISCLIGDPAFDTVQDNAFTGAVNARTRAAGSHYFVISPSGAGISPIWDQTAQGADNFVVGAKKAGVKAPTGAQDVDWLEISNVEGKLATTVYRTDTRGGPAPASCEPGSAPLSVGYASKYWLF